MSDGNKRVKMQSLSIFQNITKTADVSRIQRLCHVIFIVFGSALSKI